MIMLSGIILNVSNSIGKMLYFKVLQRIFDKLGFDKFCAIQKCVISVRNNIKITDFNKRT